MHVIVVIIVVFRPMGYEWSRNFFPKLCYSCPLTGFIDGFHYSKFVVHWYSFSMELFLTSCFAAGFLGCYQIFSWLFVFTGDATKIDFQSLLSLADEGIDVSFLKASGNWKRRKSRVCHVRGAVSSSWLVGWASERAVRVRTLGTLSCVLGRDTLLPRTNE